MAVTIRGSGQLVVQVQNTIIQNTTNPYFSTSNTTLTAVTGLLVNITPTSASNKILITACFPASTNANNAACYISLFRNGTNVVTGNANGTLGNTYTAYYYVSDLVNLTWLDSPATTSSITYQVYIAGGQGGSGTAVSVGGFGDRNASALSIMAQEIAYA